MKAKEVVKPIGILLVATDFGSERSVATRQEQHKSAVAEARHDNLFIGATVLIKTTQIHKHRFGFISLKQQLQRTD